jgi:hypothetical protein
MDHITENAESVNVSAGVLPRTNDDHRRLEYKGATVASPRNQTKPGTGAAGPGFFHATPVQAPRWSSVSHARWASNTTDLMVKRLIASGSSRGQYPVLR